MGAWVDGWESWAGDVTPCNCLMQTITLVDRTLGWTGWDGWTDGRMDGRTDGWMDEWMDR
eukprot:360117-Chlamydomonas_euryale.AAC.3